MSDAAGRADVPAVDLGGQAVGWLSLRGATVAQADLTGLTIAEGLLGATLRGAPEGLTVNGFDVAALIWDELVRRDPPRALTRSARLDDLRDAWSLITERWRATEARAARLGDTARDERVAGEWSFAETLRHLVFVTDAWVGRVVLGLAAPYHAASLPPSFLPDMSAAGIDVRRPWDFDEVLTARRERQALVDRLLAGLADADLERVCGENAAFGFPPVSTVPVIQCLHTVLDEEWAHHGYAVRDLTALESRS
ncbi:MAG TPA: DinB family protein [Ilumatobacteraceae bacterium]|nr:DinB family protein [Ilumatobacteraceae bacterium]